AMQSEIYRQPPLPPQKNNKRYYIEFDGIDDLLLSDVNLNAIDGTPDITHVYIVYQLLTHDHNAYPFRNGLMGQDDGKFGKYVCFYKPGNKLVIAGTQDKFIILGNGNTPKKAIAPFQTNADPSELNKWCCLSVHWDNVNGSNASSVYCNGKKLTNFTSRAATKGSDKTALGSINLDGLAPLHGYIQFFAVYRGFVMNESLIKTHHKVLCERYNVA
ncbi:MAG: hypothetical protein J4F36_14680, partial [Nitrosopumilaceae archaeon]|nr:hypothetical protein [Nitrosopumilaceae archaeon]